MEANYKELSVKVKRLEEQVEKIKTIVDKQGIADARLEEKLKALEHQVMSIKQDVITTLNEHSDKTWTLINKGIKVICILVGIICAMAGVKLLPDVFSVFNIF